MYVCSFQYFNISIFQYFNISIFQYFKISIFQYLKSVIISHYSHQSSHLHQKRFECKLVRVPHSEQLHLLAAVQLQEARVVVEQPVAEQPEHAIIAVLVLLVNADHDGLLALHAECWPAGPVALDGVLFFVLLVQPRLIAHRQDKRGFALHAVIAAFPLCV